MTPHTHDRTAWLQGGDARCRQSPTQVQRIWRLVILGAPGSGKGTQSSLLSRALGVCQLSTGDVLRTARTTPSPAGSPMAEAQACLCSGKLVPDETVFAIIEARRRCLHCCGGFILDGFPRTLVQARGLDALLEREVLHLDAVINLEVPVATLVSRIGGRRVCPACHATYHMTQRPPREIDRCDLCQTTLSIRADDNIDAIHTRLAAYQETMEPLLAHYRECRRLVSVEATGEPGDILARTLDALAPIVLGR